tara:strand:- start:23696 stop:24076 length:381 start_codon:yes stop_codon:yes gene_type:complete
MKNLCLMLILVPAVLGCAAGSQASIAVGVQSASCDIRPVYSHGILSLDGEVFGKPGETGIYRFVLNRNGAGGSSDVQQSGDYVIAPEGRVAVMSTQVSLGRHDHYSAVLEVENAHGIASCEAGNIP